MVVHGTNHLDLISFFKITHGLVETSALPVIHDARKTTRSSSSNSTKYVPKCKTTTYQQSFLIRTCRIWNTLVDELNFDTDSFNFFKFVLQKYYYKSLEVNYNDPENPRTFRTIWHMPEV